MDPEIFSHLHPPKQTWNLKMGAPWNLGDAYWKPSFPGSMLIFEGVNGVFFLLKMWSLRKFLSRLASQAEWE